jgi:hypothetical protein
MLMVFATVQNVCKSAKTNTKQAGRTCNTEVGSNAATHANKSHAALEVVQQQPQIIATAQITWVF